LSDTHPPRKAGVSSARVPTPPHRPMRAPVPLGSDAPFRAKGGARSRCARRHGRYFATRNRRSVSCAAAPADGALEPDVAIASAAEQPDSIAQQGQGMTRPAAIAAEWLDNASSSSAVGCAGARDRYSPWSSWCSFPGEVLVGQDRDGSGVGIATANRSAAAVTIRPVRSSPIATAARSTRGVQPFRT
jgi:hypothetical protein